MRPPEEIVRDVKRRAAEHVADALAGHPNLDTYGMHGGPEEVGVLYLPADLIEPVRALISARMGRPAEEEWERLPLINPEAN